jgi:transcriptional regulator with XRE-family HTH domain
MDWCVENYKGNQNTRLLQLMGYKGYTIRSLAEETGVSEKTLWCMIQGRSYPRLDTILLVCHTLNCTIDYLYPMDYNTLV